MLHHLAGDGACSSGAGAMPAACDVPQDHYSNQYVIFQKHMKQDDTESAKVPMTIGARTNATWASLRFLS
jgi:hypothetical protein